MADETTIIRMSELGAFVASTLEQINKGVGLANKGGIVFDMMDEKVTFDILLISEFQTIPMKGGESTGSTEIRKGTSETITDSTDDTINGGTSTEFTPLHSDIHAETNAETVKFKDDDE